MPALFQITPKRLEAVGVGFIFLAAFWEATVLRQLAESYNLTPFVELNVKLNMLWTALGVNGDLDAMHKFVFDNNNGYWNDYRFIENFNYIKKHDPGLSQFSVIRWFIFGIGTLLVMAGKWWDGAPK
jgi:hypothetical protein